MTMNPMDQQDNLRYRRDDTSSVIAVLVSVTGARRLMNDGPRVLRNEPVTSPPFGILCSRRTHTSPKAKSVIFLFMAGGPSQLEMFDYKPNWLNSGAADPESYVAGKRFAFMNSSHRIICWGPKRSFHSTARTAHGSVTSCRKPPALWTNCVSSRPVRQTSSIMRGQVIHENGSGLFGRPSMGSWIIMGSAVNATIPGFVVLQSGPRGPRGGAVLWGSGILPTTYQGVPLRNTGDPILNLSQLPMSLRRTAAGCGMPFETSISRDWWPRVIRRLQRESALRNGLSHAVERSGTDGYGGGNCRDIIVVWIKDPRESSFAETAFWLVVSSNAASDSSSFTIPIGIITEDH